MWTVCHKICMGSHVPHVWLDDLCKLHWWQIPSCTGYTRMGTVLCGDICAMWVQMESWKPSHNIHNSGVLLMTFLALIFGFLSTTVRAKNFVRICVLTIINSISICTAQNKNQTKKLTKVHNLANARKINITHAKYQQQRSNRTTLNFLQFSNLLRMSNIHNKSRISHNEFLCMFISYEFSWCES